MRVGKVSVEPTNFVYNFIQIFLIHILFNINSEDFYKSTIKHMSYGKTLNT
jgi:hypothetical protein